MKNKKIIVVADVFSDDYQGGAELSLESIIETSPYELIRKKSFEVNKEFVNENINNFWIFGNFASLPRELLIYFVKKDIQYSVFEYDYKYCSYRSTELHNFITKEECNCHEKRHGKEIALFFYKASLLWWMSEKQKLFYEERFDFLRNHPSSEVLTSTFSERDTLFMKALCGLDKKRTDEFIILDSDSWIKGKNHCISMAEKNNFSYKLVSGLSRHQFLRLLSESKGLIFLPLGKDTCPRLVIEASLLGCKLIVNKSVQHTSEEWFSKPRNEIFNYLESRKYYFWEKLEDVLND